MGFMLKKPDGVAGSVAPAILVGVFVAFGGVLFGSVVTAQRIPQAHTDLHSYDTGTIGGILGMKYWEDHFSTGYHDPKTGLLSVTASQESEIVSILSAGTFFGGTWRNGRHLGRH